MMTNFWSLLRLKIQFTAPALPSSFASLLFKGAQPMHVEPLAVLCLESIELGSEKTLYVFQLHLLMSSFAWSTIGRSRTEPKLRRFAL